MIGRLVRLTVLGFGGAWLVDALLVRRDVGRTAAPIVTSVAIRATRATVWPILVDLARQPEWMRDLKSVEILTPGPLGVGTRATGLVRVFGLGVQDPIEVTAFEPPSRYAIRHVGLVTGSGEIRLDEDGVGGTLVTWTEVLVPPVLPRLGALVLGLVFGPIFRADLERLRDLVEADEPSGRVPASHVPANPVPASRAGARA